LKNTIACSLVLAVSAVLSAQTDPGVRTGPALSGRPLDNLAPQEAQAFQGGLRSFTEVEDVAQGLGPRFNSNSCASCHIHPSVGGTSPAVNPLIAVAAANGAANQVPPFEQANGPVRAVRFKRTGNGQPDGGVHNLFTISGRTDAPSECQITQPDFSNTNNLAFRIPTPTFGLGLIESITDAALRANLTATQQQRQALGIGGTFNTNGNDGTITRYGWKAQNKSLLLFAAEAYNVEVGVTNELFPQERDETPACATNPLPEDHAGPQGRPADILAFADFMRYLAPPQPTTLTESTANGAALFASVGCALCHTPALRTGNVASAALRNQAVNLYSDLALHRMGQALNDGITQGQAQGDQWRTAPLWGLGDRIFLLHDGRTQDLAQAIALHDSQGSEAHQVIVNYSRLSAGQKQDVLNFLRSL